MPPSRIGDSPSTKLWQQALNRPQFGLLALALATLTQPGLSLAQDSDWKPGVSETTPDFLVPADAGLIDVTDWSDDPALNADPAPGNDDTAALQAVLDAHAGGGRIIYLPAGQYDVTKTLLVPIKKSNRASAYTILQGQNRDRTVIRLSEGIGLEGAVLAFQIKTADAFRNAVRDLTIEVGPGNPAADGLRFTGSNQAIVQNVAIRSTDPQQAGHVGLQLGTGRNGPLLVKNVLVAGFEVGIVTRFQTASQTFENIALTAQTVAGWVNSSDQNVFVRGLRSINTVRAIHNGPLEGYAGGQNAVFTLIDSELVGIGPAAETHAIHTEERLYARNVSTAGYKQPVLYSQIGGYGPIAGNKRLDGDFIDEYWSEGTHKLDLGGTFELFDHTPDTSLGLPIKPSPSIPPDPDLANWACPAAFVTTNVDGTACGLPDDGLDDTAAIQAAIDSGATTIYLPSGTVWTVEGVVEVRGRVERFTGLEGRLRTRTGHGIIRIGQTTADTVVFERFGGGGNTLAEVQHDSDATLVARNLQGFRYRPVETAPGDLFLDDVVHGDFVFRNQHVWARQLNPEAKADINDPAKTNQKILVDNASLWVLGLKIEQEGTIARVINGGRAELLGVYRNNNNPSDADNPAFVADEASLSVVNFDAATPAGNAYALWASETRNGETRISQRFGGGHVYAGFDEAALWDVRHALIIDNSDPEVRYDGQWDRFAGLPGGYIDDDIAYSRDPEATATFIVPLPVAGRYELFTRWINDKGGQRHAGHGVAVPLAITHAGGTDNQTIDQRTGGGRWVSAGTFDFDETATIRLGVADGKTIIDGLKAVLRETDNEIPTLAARFPITAGTDRFAAVAGGTITTDSLLANDTHDGGQPLTVTGTGQPIGGIVTATPDGQLTYTAHGWFSGLDTFDYTVSDGTRTATGVVQVTVQPLVDPETGQPRRPLTEAEQREAAAPLIETVRVVEYNGAGAERLLGPGLSDPLPTTIAPVHAAMKPRSRDSANFTGPVDAAVTLDLGGVFDLATMRLWNANEHADGSYLFAAAGARTIAVSVDADADGNGQPYDLRPLRSIDLPQASRRSDYTGELFDLTGTRARFVRLAITAAIRKDRAGLSAVQFRGRQVQPAASPRIEGVTVVRTSSQLNPDRPGSRTLGFGFHEAGNRHETSRRGHWESAADDPAPAITYDLGQPMQLGSLRLWNANNGGRLTTGAAAIEVATSSDGTTFTTARTITPRIGSGSGQDNGQAFDLTGAGGRYVRLTITKTHGATDGASLAEARFFGEPME